MRRCEHVCVQFANAFVMVLSTLPARDRASGMAGKPSAAVRAWCCARRAHRRSLWKVVLGAVAVCAAVRCAVAASSTADAGAGAGAGCPPCGGAGSAAEGLVGLHSLPGAPASAGRPVGCRPCVSSEAAGTAARVGAVMDAGAAGEAAQGAGAAVDAAARGHDGDCSARTGRARVRSTLWPLLACGDADTWLRAVRAAALAGAGPASAGARGPAAAAGGAARGGAHVVSTAPDGADTLEAVADAVAAVAAAGAHARDGAHQRALAALLGVARGPLLRAGGLLWAAGGVDRHAADARGGGGGAHWPCWLACAAMDAAWREGDTAAAAAAASHLPAAVAEVLPAAVAEVLGSGEGAIPAVPVNAYAALLAAYIALDGGAGARGRVMLGALARSGAGAMAGAGDGGTAPGPVASLEDLPDGPSAIASCVLRVLRTAPLMRSAAAHAACGAGAARGVQPHPTAAGLVALYHGPAGSGREAVGAWLEPILTVLERGVWAHAGTSCEVAVAQGLGVFYAGPAGFSDAEASPSGHTGPRSTDHDRRRLHAVAVLGSVSVGAAASAARACVDALPQCADASLIAGVAALREGRRAEAAARSRRARSLALKALRSGRAARGACDALDPRLAAAFAEAFWSASGEPQTSAFAFSMSLPAPSDADRWYSIAVASTAVEATAYGRSPAGVDRVYGWLVTALVTAAAPDSVVALAHASAGWWYLRHAGVLDAVDRWRPCEHFARACAVRDATPASAIVGRAFAVRSRPPPPLPPLHRDVLVDTCVCCRQVCNGTNDAAWVSSAAAAARRDASSVDALLVLAVASWSSGDAHTTSRSLAFAVAMRPRWAALSAFYARTLLACGRAAEARSVLARVGGCALCASAHAELSLAEHAVTEPDLCRSAAVSVSSDSGSHSATGERDFALDYTIEDDLEAAAAGGAGLAHCFAGDRSAARCLWSRALAQYSKCATYAVARAGDPCGVSHRGMLTPVDLVAAYWRGGSCPNHSGSCSMGARSVALALNNAGVVAYSAGLHATARDRFAMALVACSDLEIVHANFAAVRGSSSSMGVKGTGPELVVVHLVVDASVNSSLSTLIRASIAGPPAFSARSPLGDGQVWCEQLPARDFLTDPFTWSTRGLGLWLSTHVHATVVERQRTVVRASRGSGVPAVAVDLRRRVVVGRTLAVRPASSAVTLRRHRSSNGGCQLIRDCAVGSGAAAGGGVEQVVAAQSGESCSAGEVAAVYFKRGIELSEVSPGSSGAALCFAAAAAAASRAVVVSTQEPVPVVVVHGKDAEVTDVDAERAAMRFEAASGWALLVSASYLQRSRVLLTSGSVTGAFDAAKSAADWSIDAGAYMVPCAGDGAYRT